MEVHHHSNHTESHSKSWKAYFFEFLMLFLAVFCGFIAENLREERVERHREKDFILSMIEDLKKDTTNVAQDAREFKTLNLVIDSVFMNFDMLYGSYNHLFFEQLKNTLGYPDFIYNDKTMQQLKSAGNMRLIKNKTALDSMIIYDNNIRDYLLEVDGLIRLFDSYNEIYFQTIDVQRKIADLKIHTPEELTLLKKNYLITRDPEKLAWFRNKLVQYKITCDYNSGRELEIKNKATSLIHILQREYGLD